MTFSRSCNACLLGAMSLPRSLPSLLRDTFAVRYLQAGGDPCTLQELLGLQDPVSVKRYQHSDGGFGTHEAGVRLYYQFGLRELITYLTPTLTVAPILSFRPRLAMIESTVVTVRKHSIVPS